ncbi:neural-cadherin-like [Macrobrachium rosenbergii]|uniref:neural-cadherin-like n=1 Tax=Macrobrachium rosenbergii TaxID=79674 RepID=UPI0034D55ECC
MAYKRLIWLGDTVVPVCSMEQCKMSVHELALKVKYSALAEGATVKYSISGGNAEALFDIDEFTGVVKLVAPLDFETTDKHEIVVTGEGGGQVVQAVVEVTVTDVNDNSPIFINPDPHVTVIEEDDRHLPASLLKVEAKDPDQMDQLNLRYSISGDGIDGYLPGDAYFSINSKTGDLIQLKALDRDPPHGKRFWRLNVKVEDGQESWNPKTHSYYLGNQLEYQNDQGRVRYPDDMKNEEQSYQKNEKSSWYLLHPSSQTGLEFNTSRKKDRYNILTSSHQAKKRMRDFKEIPASKKMRLFNDDTFGSAVANSFTNQRQSVELSLHKKDWESNENKDKVITNERHPAEVNTPWKTSGYHADSIFGSHEVHPRKDIKSKKNERNFAYHLNAPGSQIKTVTEQVIPVSVEKSRKTSIVNHKRGRHSKRNGEDNHTFVSDRTVQQSISSERHLGQSLIPSGETRNVTVHSIYESRVDTMVSMDGHTPEYPKNDNQDSYENVIFVNKRGNISESRTRTEHEDVHGHKNQHPLTSVGVKKNKIRFSWSKEVETDQLKTSNEQRMARFLYKHRRNIRDIHIPGEKMFMGFQSQHENISGKNSDFISHKQRVPAHIQISDTVLDSVDANRSELRRGSELYECNGDHKNGYVDVKHIYKNQQRFYSNITKILQDGNSAGLSSLNNRTSKYEPAKTKNEPLSSDSITNPTISKERMFARKTTQKSSKSKISLKGKDNNPSKYYSATLERNHPKTPERKNIQTTFDPTEARPRTESFLAKGSDLGQKYSSSASIKTISSKRLANPLLDKHTQHYDNRKKDAGFGVPRFGEPEKHLGIAPQMDPSFYQFQDFAKVSNSKVFYQLSDSPKYIRSKRFHFAENVSNHSYSPSDVNSNMAYVGKKSKFFPLSPITSGINKLRDVHKENLVRNPYPFQSPRKMAGGLPYVISDNAQTNTGDLSSFSEKDMTIKGDWLKEHDYRPPYNAEDSYDDSDIMKPSNITYNTDWKEKQVTLNDVLTFSRVTRDTNRKQNQMRREIRTNSRIPTVENTKQYKIDKDDVKAFRGKRKANDERNRLETSDIDESDGYSQKDDTCPGLNTSLTQGVGENVNQDKSSVHSAETTVTIIVKDINDNPPVFPNATMFGEIQENGPAELSVAQVSAWDNDDATEGTNARITYFIEKNVIHDRTGEAIFDVHPKSGLITTAICCLDRETTPEYSIQVVAADGGGLKGTGTVLVRLKDENDNLPHLARKSWDLEIVETPGEGRPDSGTLLEMTVGDPDSHNDFHFRIVKDSGPGWDRFGIRSSGASGQLYALQKLDYEDEGHRRGFRFMVQVTDKGEEGWEDPRHQDTAWVGVKLKDRNDNPPLFNSPNVHLSVSEDTAPGTILVNMTATDPDKGRGGQVKYQVFGRWDTLRMDELGSVTLYRTLDRESEDEVEKVFRILAMDHGDPPLTSTATLTITVTDVNDCPPRLLPPTILHVTEGEPPSLLGVLTVTDDDIWSLGHGPPFTLALSPSNPRNILHIVELKFFQHLDDGRGGAELWTRGSLDREANRELQVQIFLSDSGHLNNTQIVTIIVGDLNDNPMKPASKTVYLWKAQVGGGKLGKLINAVQEITDLADYRTEVVSVYGTDGSPDAATFNSVVPFNPLQKGDDLYPGSNRNPRNSVGQHSALHLNSYACVWLSVTDYQGIFMDPVRLQGLIALHSRDLEKATGFVVTFKNPSSHFEHDRRNMQKIPFMPPHPTLGEVDPIWGSSEYLSTSSSKHVNEEGPGRVASMASSLLPLQLHTFILFERRQMRQISNNRQVGTRQQPMYYVIRRENTKSDPQADMHTWCICPGGSKGPQCKIYSRTFNGNGWAWLKPPSTCLPMTISVRLLTQKPDGLLLYNGPLVPPSDAGKLIPTPMLTVQLVNQRPQVLIQGIGEFFKLQVNKSVSDGNWHTVYVRLDRLGISMMVDICGFGRSAKLFGDSHCVARKLWRNHHTLRMWESVGPLQIGGIAQRHPRSLDFGWEDSVTPHRFDGCLSHLTVNGQILDLGEPSYSEGSLPSCRMQDLACINGDGPCGIHSECTGGLWKPKCQCEPGWSGLNCETPTVPTTLGLRSYIKVALSFTPPSQNFVIQVRVRTLGFKTGMLMHLVTQQTNSSITLHLQSGVACASMSVAGLTARTACVNGHPVGDGKWHTIRAESHGHNLIAIVDDGDDGRLNYSIPSPVTHIQENSQKVTRRPMTLQIDKHDGVTIGGLPHLEGASLVGVKEDLTETCIDDLRISDRQLPLPPAVNGSSWGQVTNSNGLLQGCQPQRSCLNVTCKRPLSCHHTWLSPKCSCGPGLQYIDHACADVDECLLKPCLHGGTCVNLHPGYKCLCGPNYLGDNCEWAKITGAAHPLSTPVIVASITSSLLALEADDQQRVDEESPDKTSITATKTEGDRASRTSRERDTGKKETDSLDEALRVESQQRDEGAKPRGPEDDSHTTFLELLKLSKSLPRKDVQGCDDGAVGGIAMNVITASGGTAQDGAEPLPQPHQHPLRQTHLSGEDLHIYAYEGDGSSSGSLTSTISGLQAEVDREESNNGTVVSEFLEVIDLLKNLSDAPSSSSLLSKLKQKKKSEKVSQGEKLLGCQRSIVESTGAKTSSEVPTGPSASSLERRSKVRGLLHVSRELRDDIKTTAC